MFSHLSDKCTTCCKRLHSQSQGLRKPKDGAVFVFTADQGSLLQVWPKSFHVSIRPQVKHNTLRQVPFSGADESSLWDHVPHLEFFFHAFTRFLNYLNRVDLPWHLLLGLSDYHFFFSPIERKTVRRTWLLEMKCTTCLLIARCTLLLLNLLISWWENRVGIIVLRYL